MIIAITLILKFWFYCNNHILTNYLFQELMLIKENF